MNRYFGYVRISTPQQNLQRQIRNILAEYPQAEIIEEIFTGRKFQGRKEFDKLIRKINTGDTIIFDSVSRMSRDAEEGFAMYNDLFGKGINLIFLKEPHINTDTYKSALQGGIPTTEDKKVILVFNKSDLLSNSQKRKSKTSDNVQKKDCKPPGSPVSRLDKSLEESSQQKNLLLLKQLS